VLVAGLLVIGALAAEDGIFAAAGAAAARLPGSGLRLLTVLLLFEACVTAVLNLDTAVVFLTPASSSGSNLTNLIVLTHEHVPGHLFAARMLPRVDRSRDGSARPVRAARLLISSSPPRRASRRRSPPSSAS
jgi:arsenical pump membrane protein